MKNTKGPSDQKVDSADDTEPKKHKETKYAEKEVRSALEVFKILRKWHDEVRAKGLIDW